MKSCHRATFLLSQSQERELTLRERWGLRLHLLLCTMCRRFAAQVRFLAELGRHMDATPGEPGLSPDARFRILETLRREP